MRFHGTIPFIQPDHEMGGDKKRRTLNVER